jgi:uncharacterized membrane protein
MITSRINWWIRQHEDIVYGIIYGLIFASMMIVF